VVNYNSAASLRRCLASIDANAVVVVDNGSTDCSAEVARSQGATWIEAGENLGYGRAANLGASCLPARECSYLLVCNPDIELDDGAMVALTKALESDPTIGVVGPCLRNPDGSIYPSGRTFPTLAEAIGHGALGLLAPMNRFTRRYRMLGWDRSDPALVDWVSGACLLARREAWDAVGGFDPAYFMYMEDVDLCWRLGRAGWRVLFEPAAGAIHVQGVSTGQHPYRMLAAHHRSMWRFACRTSTGAGRLALPLVAAGLVGRFGVAAAEHRLRRRSSPPRGVPSREGPPAGLA
jgi:N-acetylglucosaminyl-diphospho-decaprenol L-rhamnosyltransferase